MTERSPARAGHEFLGEPTSTPALMKARAFERRKTILREKEEITLTRGLNWMVCTTKKGEADEQMRNKNLWLLQLKI